MNDATSQLTQQLLQGLLMPERKEPKPKDDSLLNSILGAIIGRGLGGGIGAAAPPSNTQGVLGPLGGPLAQSGVAAAGPILAGMGVPFVPGANVIGALATQKQFGGPQPGMGPIGKAPGQFSNWTDYFYAQAKARGLPVDSPEYRAYLFKGFQPRGPNP